MDTIDVKIVRELSQGRNVGLMWGDVDPAFREIGRRLEVSKETVRDRIHKMQQSGFLKPFPIQVNPSLLGLSMGTMGLYGDPRSSPELLRKLALVDGMLMAMSYVGGLVATVFYYGADSLQRQIGLIKDICSCDAAEFTTVPVPPCEIGVSRLDWRIIAALQGSTKETEGGIPSALGISGKTLQRHLKRLIQGGAISRLISTDIRRLRSAVMAGLVVHYTAGANRTETDGALMKEFDESLILVGFSNTFSAYNLILPSIPEAEKALEAARSTKGVQDARIDLASDRIECYGLLAEQVKKKLEAPSL